MSIECDKPSSKVLESKELPQKIFKTITNDDVGVENSKPNKYTLSVDGKSHSKISNNFKTSSSTHKLKANKYNLSLGKNSKKTSSNLHSISNDCPVSLECDHSASKVSVSKDHSQKNSKTCDTSSSKVFKSK